MIDKFRKLGELKKLRDQAVALKKVLAAEEIIVEEKGVRAVVGGDQKIREVVIDGQSRKSVTDVLNKAIKKSQKLAARKLQAMGGGFGLPGM